MKKLFFVMFGFIILLCSSCNNTDYVLDVSDSIDEFMSKLDDSDSYVYTNNVKVTVGNYRNGVLDYKKVLYKQEISMQVNNVEDVFDLSIKRDEDDRWYDNTFYYALKNDSIYYASKLYLPTTESKVLDLLSYFLSVDDFYSFLESTYRLNIDGRLDVFDIDSKSSFKDGVYSITYGLNEFVNVFNDYNVNKYLDRMSYDDAFVKVDYVFELDRMSIVHNLNFNDVDNICLETVYEIKDIDLESFDKKTIYVELKDIDDSDIIDASGFEQIYLTMDRDRGYFKVYLDKGEYNLILNMLGFSANIELDYSIYNSNKEKLDDSITYNLDAGYYYIYVDYESRFPIIINKFN